MLAYIERQDIEKFLDYATGAFECLCLLDYDMVNPNDPFGKMMVYNFKQRGVPLVGMSFFDSLTSVKQHLEARGFEVTLAHMRDVYYKRLDQKERQRIEKLEFLDEFEEFWLLLEHYFMSLAKKPKSAAKKAGDLRFEVTDGLSLFHTN